MYGQTAMTVVVGERHGAAGKDHEAVLVLSARVLDDRDSTRGATDHEAVEVVLEHLVHVIKADNVDHGHAVARGVGRWEDHGEDRERERREEAKDLHACAHGLLLEIERRTQRAAFALRELGDDT
jgi:hypothetical protein